MEKKQKTKIKTKIELYVYESLDEQIAFQMGLAVAFAVLGDVICQFSEDKIKNGKLPDFCTDDLKIGYKKGVASTLICAAELFDDFTSHAIFEGEKILRDKGWKGMDENGSK